MYKKTHYLAKDVRSFLVKCSSPPLRHRLQHFFQQRIKRRYRRNMHPFVGRVRAGDGRAEGDHIHARIFAAEDAAFQSGVDGLDFRFVAFHPGKYFFADAQQVLWLGHAENLAA